LVCEIAYAEWTEDGELRQTTFLGWRDDKKPEDVVLEQPKIKSIASAGWYVRVNPQPCRRSGIGTSSPA
jgi:ATP-dependent DNA ligase